MQTFRVPAGSHPHDVAPAADGGIWYTAQAKGTLAWLNPKSGEVREITLGPGSQPHGVILGPDGAPWVTDGGLEAIVRVDPATRRVSVYPLPDRARPSNLNTATFDSSGTLWFTANGAGMIGSLVPSTGAVQVFDAPRGAGPYGMTSTPDGDVFFASLAGSYVGEVNRATGAVAVHDPPSPGAGTRRVWSDSRGRVWVSEWNAGQVAVFDPAADSWREWRLPGASPRAYAVYVDETNIVWLTDFGANAIVRFDPSSKTFRSFPLGERSAEVRQLHGRPGEVWGAESALDQLVVIRFGS
jgi:virginiamycin B lyase